MNDKTQRRFAQQFRALHHAPAGFVLPNAWDAGSAILMAEAGFPAVATTSAGIAFSLGKQDYRVSDPELGLTRSEMFGRLREIVGAAAGPVSADLEAGWGDAPEAVVETIGMAVEIGLAGGNIEDKPADGEGLYDEGLAVERIAAAAEAIRARGEPFVLNARTDILQQGSAAADIARCIHRANRFLQAGADCVFTPGAADMPAIRSLAREIEGPLNIVVGLGSAPTDIPAILQAGVKRVSLGGTLARAAFGFLRQGLVELKEAGSIGFAAGQMSGTDLNAMFARHARRRAETRRPDVEAARA